MAIISMNRLDSQITFQPKKTFPLQYSKAQDRAHLTRPKQRIQRKVRCQYCQDNFLPGANKRGSCNAAPDKIDSYIEIGTCVCCLQALVYHCMSDSENEFSEPCSCDFSERSNYKKWAVFAVLSLFLPCMCCYWPLKACHRLGVACGCCGGRHKASRSDTVLDVI